MSSFTKLSTWEEQAICNPLRESIRTARTILDAHNKVLGVPVATNVYQREIQEAQALLERIETYGLWFGEQKGVTII